MYIVDLIAKKKCTKVKGNVGDPDGGVISQIGCLAKSLLIVYFSLFIVCLLILPDNKVCKRYEIYMHKSKCSDVGDPDGDVSQIGCLQQ